MTMKLLYNQTHLVKGNRHYWNWLGLKIDIWLLFVWMDEIHWMSLPCDFSELFILISNLEKCLRYVPFLITLRFLKLMKWKKKNTDRNTVVGLVGCRADVYQSFHSQSEKWDEKHFQMLKVGPRNSYSSFDFKRSW